MTPSLARMLTLDPRAYAALGSLKQILLGGEAVPAALIHHLRQVFNGEIHNMYGPTETTIWSTTCRVREVWLDRLHWTAHRQHANLYRSMPRSIPFLRARSASSSSAATAWRAATGSGPS